MMKSPQLYVGFWGIFVYVVQPLDILIVYLVYFPQLNLLLIFFQQCMFDVVLYAFHFLVHQMNFNPFKSFRLEIIHLD